LVALGGKIAHMLQWLATHVQADWEEDSKKEDGVFQYWGHEVVNRVYKPRQCNNYFLRCHRQYNKSHMLAGDQQSPRYTFF